MVPLGSLLPPALLLAAGFAPTSPFRPMLFMDAEDTADGWGLMEPQASSVVPNAAYRPPPLPYQLGSLVISVMESASHPGSWEVYAENTTGWFVPAPPPPPPSPSPHVLATFREPLRAGAGAARDELGAHHDCGLLRFTTRDFVTYSPPHTALHIPSCSGTPTMKSIARSPQGLYAMFTVGGGDGASGTYTSRDEGMTWHQGVTAGVAKPDKDDLNLIYCQVRRALTPCKLALVAARCFSSRSRRAQGRFVDMQIRWQNHTLRPGFCDNGGCDRRRVITAKTSHNGVDCEHRDCVLEGLN